MTHRVMAAIADALEGLGVATLRYQFPFMEKVAAALMAGRGAGDGSSGRRSGVPVRQGDIIAVNFLRRRRMAEGLFIE
jgi:hypothetical protein